MTKQKQLQLMVSEEVYEAIQEEGLRMVLISPEGEQAALVWSEDTGYLPYDTVEISQEGDKRKRKLDFEFTGSDAVKYPYAVRAGNFYQRVLSRQLRVVLGEPIEAKKDAIEEEA